MLLIKIAIICNPSRNQHKKVQKYSQIQSLFTATMTSFCISEYTSRDFFPHINKLLGGTFYLLTKKIGNTQNLLYFISTSTLNK